MKSKPYIGVTGVTSLDEADGVIKAFNEAGYTLNSAHVPMIGFLASLETICGLSKRKQPPLTTLPALLKHVNGKAFPMIHYYADSSTAIPSQVSYIFRFFDSIYESGLCRALQLNMAWPEVSHIIEIKEIFPEMQIVFQVKSVMLEQGPPHNIVSGIRTYGENMFDYVLVDPSEGKGIEFDLEKSIAFYKELRERVPEARVGFAGGLNGNNVTTKVKSLIDMLDTSDFCIDAEGGLRNNKGYLDLGEVRKYVKEASHVLP